MLFAIFHEIMRLVLQVWRELIRTLHSKIVSAVACPAAVARDKEAFLDFGVNIGADALITSLGATIDLVEVLLAAKGRRLPA